MPTMTEVRVLTEALAAPLSPEDQTVQSMPDVSPTKWHRAHTTWFFETFILEPHLPGYERFDDEFAFLFNSYYEALGSRHARAERGLITRPGAERIGEYRRHVDSALDVLHGRGPDDEVAQLLQIGLHHEQQHQELLCMDITHVLSTHPFDATYRSDLANAHGARRAQRTGLPEPLTWTAITAGPVTVGHDADTDPGFAFDNETPAHEVLLGDVEIADRLVTNGEWSEFIDDGGYRRPELWMSEGWATVLAQGWDAPLYWRSEDGAWTDFGLVGRHAVDALGAGGARQLVRSRRVRPLEWRSPPDRGRVGSGSSTATAGRTPRPGRAVTERAWTTLRTPSSTTASCGSGPSRPTGPIPASAPPPERSVSTTASS